MTEIIPQTPVVNAGFMYVSGLKLTYSNEFEYVLSKGAARDSSNTIDIIVENKLILEIKTVDFINDVHKAQLLTYLKMTNCKLGLLLNFRTDIFKDGVKRVVNGL